jgi:hypothetical protein
MKIHDIEAPYMPKDGTWALKVWAQVAERLAPAFEHVAVTFEMTGCEDGGIHYIMKDAA